MGQTFDSELEDLIAKYRESGMTDDEIISDLELMQSMAVGRLMAMQESGE